MPKFKFRLQSYYDVKIKLEDKAKQDYGLALVLLDRERKERVRLEGERQSQLVQFRESLSGGIKPSELQSINNYIEALKKSISSANERVKKARDLAEKCRDDLSEAMKQRKMIEKLHDDAKFRFIKESNKIEQRAIDEVVSYKFNNR